MRSGEKNSSFRINEFRANINNTFWVFVEEK